MKTKRSLDCADRPGAFSLRGPGDVGGGVGVGQAEEHGVCAAHVPVVVVALDGHGGGVCRERTGVSTVPPAACWDHCFRALKRSRALGRGWRASWIQFFGGFQAQLEERPPLPQWLDPNQAGRTHLM